MISLYPQKIIRFLLLCLTLLWPLSSVQAENPFSQILLGDAGEGTETHHYLPIKEAFAFSVQVHKDNTLTAQWHIAPGYYLFRHSIRIESKNFSLSIPVLPQGEDRHDEVLGAYQAFTNALTIPVTIASSSIKNGVITFSYQGCAKAGFCYPPVTQSWKINTKQGTATLATSDIRPENSVTALANSTTIGDFFDQYSFTIVLFLFFGLGILLSLTPCVLPMIPILSAMLIGHKEKLTRQKAFSLSLTYVVSIAITYAIAGVITASVGNSVQAVLQNAWMLVFTALILVALALSLFGVYELRLPQHLEQKLQRLSTRQRRGTYIGVTIMGILSALVISPCITAPLLGALTYIANSGDILLGGLALFFLGMGMGLPLLLVATFGLSLLPKAGRWMRSIQYFFGVLLIVLALSLVARLIPVATLSHYYENTISFFSSSPAETRSVQYVSISSVNELNKALGQAQKEEKPVLIDFYADWCTSCITMERTLFNQPEVLDLLEGFSVLRIDVTRSTPETTALQNKFGVFAPPMFVFYSAQGEEQRNLTLVGEISKDTMISTLRDLTPQAAN